MNIQTAKNRRKKSKGWATKNPEEKRNETIEPIIPKWNKRSGNIWQLRYPPYLLRTGV